MKRNNKGHCHTKDGLSIARIFVLIVYCFVCFNQCQAQDECPPAQEGMPYTIECQILLSSNVGFFTWTNVPNLDNKKLSICRGYDLECEDQEPDYYSTKNTRKGDILISELKIHNVSPKNRNQTIQCTSWDAALDEHITVKTCVMKTYKLPDNPTCYAHKLEANTILVSCQISRFYPDISSQMFQSSDGSWEEITENVSYGNNQTIYESGAKFYHTTCSTVFQVKFPGNYKILVQIFPNISGHILSKSRIEVFTNEINFSSLHPLKNEPIIELKSCPISEAPLTFTCWATSYNQPYFRWYLDDVILSYNRDVTSQEINETQLTHFSSVSTYILNPSFPHQRRNLSCKVFFNNTNTGKIYKHFNNTIQIDHAWSAPQPPVFKDITGNQLGEFYIIPETSDLSLSCEVGEKELTELSHLLLRCTTQVDGQHNFIYLKGNSTSLTFSINVSGIRNLNNSLCSCSIEYDKKCGDAMSTPSVIKLYYKPGRLVERLTGKESNRYNGIGSQEFWSAMGLLLFIQMFTLATVIYIARRMSRNFKKSKGFMTHNPQCSIPHESLLKEQLRKL